VLSEPEVAVRPHRDPFWTAGRIGQRELREGSCRCDSSDPVAVELVEPEVAVRSGDDRLRPAVRGGDDVLVHAAVGGDPADAVATDLREPGVAIRSRGEPVRLTGCGEVVELGDVRTG